MNGRTQTTWSSSLPDLTGMTTAVMDPSRIEDAMRDGYATGHAAGVEDGYAEGFAAGQAAGRAALDADRARVTSVLAALEGELHRLDEAAATTRAHYESAAVDAALTIAAAVLDRELSAAADPGRDALVRALAAAPNSAATATVRLHPDDVARLGDLEGIAPGTAVTVVADPAVDPGGCMLLVGETTVDATIATALERVAEVLRS